ncbi:GATA zinc finger domain-containing protein 1 [Trichonephila inaurata madagascariensis]|uniref:GATA zinc finger domain-containing protein 1 n=1 Tax=Trichonephila inaurata madagascariensis TaxID=2747483 RepID=A0A8X6YKG5_9ARAC|nr:GATA zinc finger domain-containing protein 1 [Trichonephila inaurata madagascariensis]
MKIHRSKQNLAYMPGQNRRRISKQKQTNYKASRPISVPVSSNRVYYRGSYFTVGDVVSLVDEKQKLYFAQIRGLLQDQYCEKSAVITWLLPTKKSPKNQFDPTTYILGPEEEFPRTLDCFQFICHSPNEYFQMKSSSHPVVREPPVCGYARTSKGFRIVSLPAEEFNTDSE